MSQSVLIVDDSAMIRRIVGQILKELGFEVFLAANGLEGVDKARAQHPDLIIMDIEMPVMDGIEATTRIKSDPDTGGIPVLIFTSLGSEEDIEKCKDAGCQGMLNKPISKEELSSTINEILDLKACER